MSIFILVEQSGCIISLHAKNVPIGNYKLYYKFFDMQKIEIFNSVIAVENDWTFKCRAGNYIVEAYLCTIDDNGNIVAMEMIDQQIFVNVKPCIIKVEQSGRNVTFHANNLPKGSSKLYYKFLNFQNEEVFNSISTVDKDWTFKCRSGSYIVKAYICDIAENGNIREMEYIDQNMLLIIKPCEIKVEQSGQIVAFHADNVPEGKYKFYYKFMNCHNIEVFNSVSVVDSDWKLKCRTGNYIIEAFLCEIDDNGNTITMECIDKKIFLIVKPCEIKVEHLERTVSFHAQNIPDGNNKLYYKFLNKEKVELFNSVCTVDKDWTVQCRAGFYIVEAYLCEIDEIGNTLAMEYIDQQILLTINPCIVKVEQLENTVIFCVDNVPIGSYKFFYKFFDKSGEEVFTSITPVDSYWKLDCPAGKYMVEAYLCLVDNMGNTIDMEYIDQPIMLVVGSC
jgi:hypothetical protein